MTRHALVAGFKHCAVQTTLVCLLFAAGCATTPHKSSPPLVIVGQESNGAEIRLVPGQEMLIRLITNVRDRMTWAIVGSMDSEVLQPVGQRTFQFVDSDEKPLTRPLEELRFRATGNGEVILDLAYIPGGGTLVDSSNRFMLRVIVDPFVTSR
ncbi:MAG: hypothetical protein VX527_06295 [Planctomycetota bacterium]|nr:hypothetical protein [Planctomycetota bacterium]